MPQLHLYVSESMANAVRRRAESRGQSISRFLSEVVHREMGQGWPDGFFEDVIGGWKGLQPERPSDAFEERESF